jgi:hypothetical protein
MKPLKLNVALVLGIALLAVAMGSCKKKKTADTTPIIEEPIAEAPDTAFKTFMKASDFVPAGNTIQSMTYDPNGKNLFIYLKKSANTTGYAILQLNTQTKQSLMVYNSNDANWSNSNGSEGRRIRTAGTSLYVMGGASNDMIQRLSGLDNNGLTLAASIVAANNLNDAPYDISVRAGTLYVMTMDDKVVYGNITLSNAAAYAIGSSSHGCSIASVNNFLITSGGSVSNGAIELRNINTGAFIRSITLPTPCRSSLEVDANSKIVLVQSNKIYRYTADLLTKEEFKANGANDNCQIALVDEVEKTRLYLFDGSEVKTMTIKN